MKPFLLLQIRPEDPASDNEYEAFFKFGGFSEGELIRARMDQGELPNIDLNDYSGIIVGGGPWNVSDANEKKTEEQKNAEVWMSDLLKRILEVDFPFLGACYGFGALAVELGGVVNRDNYAESVKAIDIVLRDEAKDDPLTKDLPSPFRAMGGHKEACQQLPEQAVWLASSEECPYHMFRIGKNVYATQFHPELETVGLCLRIDIYKNAGYFPPEDAETLKNASKTETITVPMMFLKKFVDTYRQ